MNKISSLVIRTIKKIPFSLRTKKFIRRMIKPAFFYFLVHSTGPISIYHGFDRGTPIDRFYIENFLEENKQCIKGHCLELLNNDYTKAYGQKKITGSDVLDIDEANNDATIIDDLRHLKNISDNTYDCIILTQVLQFIDDIDSAISECYRILKKNGFLLVTLPSLSRIDCISGTENDYWRFTEASAKYLFQKKFQPNQLTIKTYGNTRSGIYFYTGLAQEDISKKTLEKNDPDFPLIVTVKATK